MRFGYAGGGFAIKTIVIDAGMVAKPGATGPAKQRKRFALSVALNW